MGEVPPELVDSQLCEIYGWSWAELEATPAYIRIAFAQIQHMKALKEQQDLDNARAERERNGR